MGSYILRLQRLRYLYARFAKVEAPYLCDNFQRSIHINRVLSSNITKHFIIHDLRASAQATKNADFGKVVDLDGDFDQLKDNDYSESAEFKEKQVGRKKLKERKPCKTEEAGEMGFDEIKIEEEDESEVESESESNYLNKQNFKLLKENNNSFRKIVTKLKSRKVRENMKEILVEGKRLIQDAISAGHRPLKIFFSRFKDLRTLNIPEGVQVIQVPYKTLNLWSDVVTSQGVVGVFKMPEVRVSAKCNNTIALTVICDNIRDPGNLGSILRIAAGVGAQELILTTGCVDIWDPKVLRAGAGAHFRLPIAKNFSWTDIENTIPEGMQIVLADNEVPVVCKNASEDDNEVENIAKSSFKNSSELAKTLPLHCYTSFSYIEGAVVVLGGETSGLSNEAYQFAKNRNGTRVYIPMGNATESLNIAVSLGIISYEIRRQLSFTINEEMSEEINSKDDSAGEEKSQ